VANLGKHSVLLTPIFRQAPFTVEVAAHRVAILNLDLGMIFAVELFWVENKVSCKLETRHRIFFLGVHLFKGNVSICMGVVLELKRGGKIILLL